MKHDDWCLIARYSAFCSKVNLALWGVGIALSDHGEAPPAQ